jgi:superfamily I DNA/RNA helicase
LVENLDSLIRQMDVPLQRYKLDTVDALAQSIAKEHALLGQANVLFDNKRILRLWQEVVMDNMSELSAEDLQREYQEVILYNDVTSLEQYLKTPRRGLGNALSRKVRKNVWQMVEYYQKVKAERHVVERTELFNLVARYLNDHDEHPFTHVIADEIQDFSNPELRFLRALAPVGPNDLFLVGDPYQCIYARRPNFKGAGISIQGRSRRLRVNYRTTEEIKNHAVSIVSGIEADDFDGGAENLKGYVSLLHGEAPVYQLFDSRNQEYDGITKYIKDSGGRHQSQRHLCGRLSQRHGRQSGKSSSREEGIPCWREGRGEKDGVRVSTFHRMKGLEFRVVILTDVSENTIPYHPGNYDEMDDEQSVSSTSRSARSCTWRLPEPSIVCLSPVAVNRPPSLNH